MQTDALKLDNQLCFAIYACSREITKMYQPYLEVLGVTYSQYLVMMVLWEREECTVKEIGEALYLDSGTLTPLLKRLQSAGLIHRERSAQDERKVLITLTDSGKELRSKALSIPDSIQGDACLSSTEFESLLGQFKGLLQKVHETNMKEARK
jgi:DNA-binding MarR family transcriptional regulator